jgi:hypothetical protein
MASIPLPALHLNPPPEQPNVLDQFARLQQLKNQSVLAPLQQQAAQQQVQSGALDIQGKQQDIAARQALNNAYKGAMTTGPDGQPTIDSGKLASGLASGPAAYQTPAVMKSITDFHKAVLDTQKTAQEVQTGQANILGSAAAAVKAAGYDPTLAHSLLDSLPPSPQLNAIRSQIDNPQALKQIVDSAIQNSDKQRELGAADTTAQARQTTAQMEQQKLAASMNPQSSLYAPTPAAVAMGTAPGAAQIQAGEVNQAARKAGAEESARMPGEMALGAQKQALSQGDPNAAGQLLVNGDATLAELKSRGATPDFIAKTLFAARKLSGGAYNAQAADAQFDVAKSPANVGFFGSAKSLIDRGGTLDQLADAAKAIPANQLPVFNKIEDWEKAAAGSGPIAKYASLALGVADDYSKVMGGGQGSDASRQAALNLVSQGQSPEQRAASIEGIRGAVNSQGVSRIGANPTLDRMYGSAFSKNTAPTQAPARPAGVPAGAQWNPQGNNGKGSWQLQP